MTVAPLLTAYLMPVASALAVTESVGPEPTTMTGRMRACGASPAKHDPGIGRAAMMPATKVPCPVQSASPAPPESTFKPRSTAPARARAVALTPESSTATTCLAPRVIVQTRLGWNSCCAHGVVRLTADNGPVHWLVP